MATDERVQAAMERLAAEGIEVAVDGVEGPLTVHVESSEHSEPETWLRVFREFRALNCGVKIS